MIEKFKELWGSSPWWKKALLVLAVPFLLLVGALLALGQRAPQQEPQIDREADKEAAKIEAERREAQGKIEAALRKKQADLMRQSQAMSAEELRRELLKGAGDD